MPATYLPIKLNRGHRAKRHRSNMPARSSRTGKFLRGGHRSNKHRAKSHSVSRKRHLAGLKAARTRKRHALSRRPNHRRSSSHKAKRRRRNLPQGFRFTKLGRHSPRGRFHGGWPAVSHWVDRRGKKRHNRRGKRRSNWGGRKVRYRTRNVLIHRTKRLRNPYGFDSADGFKSLGTWGKVGLAILFGLAGLAVAFGVPKGLAIATGKDSFQRGWGGVGTAALASVLVSGGVYLVSKRAGLALLAATGVGVGILFINAVWPKGAQMLVPVNEATLAAMLPTFDVTALTQTGVDQYGVPTNAYGLPLGTRRGPGDYRSSRDASLSHVRGPKDYWGATPSTKASTTGTEQGFYDSGYYGSPLATKERF